MKNKTELVILMALGVVNFFLGNVVGHLQEHHRAKDHFEIGQTSAYHTGFADGVRAAIANVKITGTNASIELADVLKEAKWPK